MKSEKVVSETIYVIAATFQCDLATGVKTSHRVGWARGFKPFSTTLGAIEWLRQECGMDSADYRLVSHYVGPANPFSTPTRCLISITLMPGGSGFAARLRQRRREYTISDEFSLFHAFEEMLNEEESDSIIAWSASPVDLLP